MKQIFNRQSLVALPFLLGLFFIAGLINANAGITVQGATIYGVTTGNQLVRFNANAPGTLTTVGAITGLQGGENILGIDFRPATGELFGLGSSSRIYIINKNTGAATAVGAPFTPALTGTEYGFDFNPTVDRIRIVGNNGQNLRANPLNGTVINDGALNPGTPAVTAAAYTNNFAGATTTTLYDIDTTTDRLLIQSNPNAGTLTDVGPLGVDFQTINGFDFFSGNNTAYAVSSNSLGTPQLFTINLTNGMATNVGLIGGAGNIVALRGIAVDTGAPATAGFGVLALTANNQLIRFNSNRANAPIGGATVTITGLQAGENILGIDFRPTNGLLYGLGSSSRIYVINSFTGVATAVGAAGGFTLSGTNFGFDFNPVPDRIRVISDTGQNLRINPNDGTATIDGAINPNATGVTAAGYTNSVPGATTTTLYTIDTNTDTLNIQNPPNNGTQVPVGLIGFDATAVNGFDIANSGNVALAALQPSGSVTSGLYRINLTTGAASFVSPINSASPIRGLAITSGSAATNILDFGGDRRADFSVFRTSNSFVFISRPDNSAFGFPFGNTEDTFQPGDYDGDGRTDLAVFRESVGTFFVMNTATNTVTGTQFGAPGDEPVARDYDGDGRTDFAVVRRSGGLLTWFILNSANNSVTGTQFGANTDVTAPGDYDGDGRFDLAVYRGNGDNPATFFVQRSSGGFTSMSFGLGSDLVVPGDYDGDGRTDFAVVRTGTVYNWYIWRSSNNTLLNVPLGTKGDLTVQNDYDGDGKADPAVYRQANGTYYFARSTSSFTLVGAVPFGQNGDYPIANYDTH